MWEEDGYVPVSAHSQSDREKLGAIRRMGRAVALLTTVPLGMHLIPRWETGSSSSSGRIRTRTREKSCVTTIRLIRCANE